MIGPNGLWANPWSGPLGLELYLTHDPKPIWGSPSLDASLGYGLWLKKNTFSKEDIVCPMLWFHCYLGVVGIAGLFWNRIFIMFFKLERSDKEEERERLFQEIEIMLPT